MWKNKLSLILIPLTLLFFLMLDGVLAVYFVNLLVNNDSQMAIQTYGTVVFIFSAYLSHHRLLPVIMVISLMYDAYYSPVMSFYTIPILFLYIVIQNVMPKIKVSFLSNVAVIAISNVIFNILVYVEAMLLNFNRLDFLKYVSQKVIPTMLFNVCLFFIIAIPMIKLSKWLDKQWHFLAINK